MHRALRLTIDGSALVHNWRWLQERAGVPAGAAIKADFFVSTWAEADELGEAGEGANLIVLHGVGPDDVGTALASTARPVLNSAEQVERWKQVGGRRSCEVATLQAWLPMRLAVLILGVLTSPCQPAPRRAVYFEVHPDEAQRVVRDCREGRRRGRDCDAAQGALVKLQGKARQERFRRGFD